MPNPLAAISTAFTAKGAIDSNKARKKASADQKRMEYASQEELKFAQEQYKDYRQNYLPYEIAGMSDEERYRQADRQYYMDKYRPLEKGLITEAGLDDREKYKTGLGLAKVDEQYMLPREREIQRLQAGQIDPGSQASIQSLLSMRGNQAGSRALQIGAERLGEEERQFNIKSQALGLGSGLRRSPTPQSSLSPSSVGNLYSAAARGAGSASRASLAYSQQLAKNTGNLAKNVTSMFLNQPAGGDIQGGGYVAPTPYHGFNEMSFEHGGEVMPKVNMQQGDYVVPADVVDSVGEEFLDKLVNMVNGDVDEKSKYALSTESI